MQGINKLSEWLEYTDHDSPANKSSEAGNPALCGLAVHSDFNTRWMLCFLTSVLWRLDGELKVWMRCWLKGVRCLQPVLTASVPALKLCKQPLPNYNLQPKHQGLWFKQRNQPKHTGAKRLSAVMTRWIESGHSSSLAAFGADERWGVALKHKNNLCHSKLASETHIFKRQMTTIHFITVKTCFGPWKSPVDVSISSWIVFKTARRESFCHQTVKTPLAECLSQRQSVSFLPKSRYNTTKKLKC